MQNINEFKGGDKLVLDITDLDMLGRGIAHLGGTTIFVENAITGEKVSAEVLSYNKGFYIAKTTNILTKSKLREMPKCPYFLECGGCDVQHIIYHKTLEFKKHLILRTLKKVAGIDYDENLITIEPSENPYFYRNKLAMQIKTVNGETKLCYYKKHSHDPIFIEACPLCDEKFNIVISLVNKFLNDNKILSSEEPNGNAKHIVARIIDNKLLLTFVLLNKNFVSVESLYQELKKHFIDVGINININTNNKEILSNNFVHLRGITYIKFKTLDVEQTITNSSFLQVNFNVQNKLYKYVTDNAFGLVVNCYSGAGLLTCLISKNMKDKIKDIRQNKELIKQKSILTKVTKRNKVIGIEINSDATKLANTLVRANKIYDVKNICGDASVVLKELNLNGNFTLVVDPPRSGLNDSIINTIKKQKPEKIIYVSCCLNSLCKNLKNLISDYEIKEIKGFDMFSQTKNLETVVVLKKSNQ